MKYAIIITIGDELLIGQIIDTNSAWIAQQLTPLGISVLQRVAVADTAAAITDALQQAMAKADLILLTGGLGPTADDVTKPVLCQFFGGNMIVHPEVLAHVSELFTKRGRPLIERNLKQAEVPDNCRVIPNRMGTAPGMLFEKDSKWIVSMPGVPFEMKSMMSETLLPEIRQHFQSEQVLIHRHILTFGEGESFLAERIKDLEAALPPYISLAYLPAPMAVKLRLSGSSKDAEQLSREMDHHRDLLAARISDRVIALEDESVEVLLARELKARNWSVGLAESCTGGYISHKLTQLHGSSSFFKGGIVSYATSVKEQILQLPEAFIQEHGVVSEPTAAAMAEAATRLMGAEIGIGITGILSADPYEDSSPVGTVFIGVHHQNKTQVKYYKLHYDRIQNKETAAQLALYFALEFVRSLPVDL